MSTFLSPCVTHAFIMCTDLKAHQSVQVNEHPTQAKSFPYKTEKLIIPLINQSYHIKESHILSRKVSHFVFLHFYLGPNWPLRER